MGCGSATAAQGRSQPVSPEEKSAIRSNDSFDQVRSISGMESARAQNDTSMEKLNSDATVVVPPQVHRSPRREGPSDAEMGIDCEQLPASDVALVEMDFKPHSMLMANDAKGWVQANDLDLPGSLLCPPTRPSQVRKVSQPSRVQEEAAVEILLASFSSAFAASIVALMRKHDLECEGRLPLNQVADFLRDLRAHVGATASQGMTRTGLDEYLSISGFRNREANANALDFIELARWLCSCRSGRRSSGQDDASTDSDEVAYESVGLPIFEEGVRPKVDPFTVLSECFVEPTALMISALFLRYDVNTDGELDLEEARDFLVAVHVELGFPRWQSGCDSLTSLASCRTIQFTAPCDHYTVIC
mmetsp:Transcript_53872/g.120975  ORF Transcript_53872/g.120975 Transcript_53872/m.120975 type:complete len:360 (-) Transcript_53872:87-1166(-)